MIVLKQDGTRILLQFFQNYQPTENRTKTVVIGNFVCVLKYLALKQNIFVTHIGNKGAFSLLTNTCLQSDTLLLLSLKSFSTYSAKLLWINSSIKSI
jgi:hypothetical protein